MNKNYGYRYDVTVWIQFFKFIIGDFLGIRLTLDSIQKQTKLIIT